MHARGPVTLLSGQPPPCMQGGGGHTSNWTATSMHARGPEKTKDESNDKKQSEGCVAHDVKDQVKDGLQSQSFGGEETAPPPPTK